MKLLITILKLLLSILLQIALAPFRLIGWVFKFVEATCRIIKNTITYLINQIENEVIK